MKNGWVEIFFGRVIVKVSGRGTERFLNILTRNGLIVWNVKRHGTETITFYMRLRDALKIRRYARKSECSVSFLQRSGVPFLTRRLLKNSGFLAGALLFGLILLFLSNLVWGIEIKGAKPVTEYKIRKELDKIGVKVGKLQWNMDNVDVIQRKLTDQIREITWVGVQLKGTTYHLRVVEKNEPKKPEVIPPRNLIAKKKATIVKTFVENGKQVVFKNDQVEKGQLLVSGIIGKEDQTEIVPAKGEILGETWYYSRVEQPLVTDFKVFSGKEKQKYSFVIGNLEIPIWGFGKPKFKNYETERNEHNVHFLKWDLPINYVSTTLREREDYQREYSIQEAEKVAIDQARKEIKMHVDEDAMINDEKILHKVVKNGKVILEIHFSVIENIAVGQPISKETQE
jgi:similar to stage IV sporulation protein